jgi:hypothetical protein
MAKVKCVVLRRFNNMSPGTETVAPSRAVFESWKAYGFVEELFDEPEEKEVKGSPLDKMVRGKEDK